MRPIDADALIKALVRKEPFNDCARVVIAECMEEVRHAPTIEPERKGKWIIDGHHIRCNQCGESMCNTDREGDAIPRNFCPNCGSDMRGDQDD